MYESNEEKKKKRLLLDIMESSFWKFLQHKFNTSVLNLCF